MKQTFKWSIVQPEFWHTQVYLTQVLLFSVVHSSVKYDDDRLSKAKTYRFCFILDVKKIPGRTSNSPESVSLLASVNAAGHKMPPMVILKGKTPRCLQSWAVQEAPENTVWTFQEKAWMCDILGEEWFQNVFIPQIWAPQTTASYFRFTW